MSELERAALRIIAGLAMVGLLACAISGGLLPLVPIAGAAWAVRQVAKGPDEP